MIASLVAAPLPAARVESASRLAILCAAVQGTRLFKPEPERVCRTTADQCVYGTWFAVAREIQERCARDKAAWRAQRKQQDA